MCRILWVNMGKYRQRKYILGPENAKHIDNQIKMSSPARKAAKKKPKMPLIILQVMTWKLPDSYSSDNGSEISIFRLRGILRSGHIDISDSQSHKDFLIHSQKTIAWMMKPMNAETHSPGLNDWLRSQLFPQALSQYAWVI